MEKCSTGNIPYLLECMYKMPDVTCLVIVSEYSRFGTTHFSYGKENDTYTLPDDPLGSFPPPAATTTYCLPSIM
jgi:hypothetical protein